VIVSVLVDGRESRIDLPDDHDAPGAPALDGEQVEGDVVRLRPGLYSVIVAGRAYEVALERPDAPGDPAGEVVVHVRGRSLAAHVQDRRRGIVPEGAPSGGSAPGAAQMITVVSPMPGRVVAVPVSAGDAVERGQTVVVLEAMKMESAINAPHPGTVAEVLVAAGVTVQQRQALVRIEARS
jgi:biotin carboxyl carrier protein